MVSEPNTVKIHSQQNISELLIFSQTKCKRGGPFDVQGRRSSNALLLCPALSGCKVSTPFDLLAVRGIGATRLRAEFV